MHVVCNLWLVNCVLSCGVCFLEQVPGTSVAYNISESCELSGWEPGRVPVLLRFRLNLSMDILKQIVIRHYSGNKSWNRQRTPIVIFFIEPKHVKYDSHVSNELKSPQTVSRTISRVVCLSTQLSEYWSKGCTVLFETYNNGWFEPWITPETNGGHLEMVFATTLLSEGCSIRATYRFGWTLSRMSRHEKGSIQPVCLYSWKISEEQKNMNTLTTASGRMDK